MWNLIEIFQLYKIYFNINKIDIYNLCAFQYTLFIAVQFSLYPRNKILFTDLSTMHALHFIFWSLDIGESFRTSLSEPNSNLREREGVITICLIHSKIFPEIVDSLLTKIWKTMCGWSKYENVVNAWLRNRGRERDPSKTFYSENITKLVHG